MYVGVAKLSLVIGDAHSLKEKRMVLRPIKDRVRDRLHVTVNEVGELDTWQRAELGCAVVSADRGKALELLDEVVRVAMSAGGARDRRHREGRDDVRRARACRSRRSTSAPARATRRRAAVDDDWVPEEWRRR